MGAVHAAAAAGGIPGLATPRPNAPPDYPGDQHWRRTVTTIDGWDVDAPEPTPSGAPPPGTGAMSITVFTYGEGPVKIGNKDRQTDAETEAELRAQIAAFVDFLDGPPKVETAPWFVLLLGLAVFGLFGYSLFLTYWHLKGTP